MDLQQPAVSFFVLGHPQHQGNMTPFGRGRHGVRDTNAKKLYPWRNTVREAAEEAVAGVAVADEAKVVEIIWYFARPKCDYGTGRNSATLKGSAPAHMTRKPDIDKLERAVLDAGTGVLWHDDSRVCRVIKEKRYVDAWVPEEGVQIRVWPA